jgi:hypothetical protein
VRERPHPRSCQTGWIWIHGRKPRLKWKRVEGRSRWEWWLEWKWEKHQRSIGLGFRSSEGVGNHRIRFQISCFFGLLEPCSINLVKMLLRLEIKFCFMWYFYYSLRPILFFANADVSITKMCLDTSILSKSIMDQGEYIFMNFILFVMNFLIWTQVWLIQTSILNSNDCMWFHNYLDSTIKCEKEFKLETLFHISKLNSPKPKITNITSNFKINSNDDLNLSIFEYELPQFAFSKQLRKNFS